MPDARPPFAASASFASTSTTPLSPTRPLKRRLLSAPDLNFFVPAEDTFKPFPYTPNHSAPSRDTHPERPVRPVVSHALSTLSMDPLPTDPDTVFIRTPFTTFPDQDKYPEGITYTTLAENQNWFLDPQDYISETSTNVNAVPYPACLEPPRGWCPARKKDLKEKGPEGWPEGEEPRLRCTFCRRTYAGVNAKSMWRRHVFEKHKIAMSNRRNDQERPRGRTSNKENKRAIGKPSMRKGESSHESILDLDETTATTVNAKGDSASPDVPSSPNSTARVVPPASPYDPLLTPRFRHSPPRLPSDQPWRFPSPSHPMHRSRELSLTMLGVASPITSTPIVPKRRARAAATPLSSPCTSNFGFETPESLAKIPPFPRALTFSPCLALEASPRPSPTSNHTRTSSDASDGWNSSKLLSDHNPFAAPVYQDNNGSPPSSSPNPGVRSGARPAVVGLGIGLLEPFILPDSCLSATDMQIDELIHLEDEDDEEEVLGALLCSQASTIAEVEDPPLKRQRMAP
ncbi:hypothetical protein C8R45DRAFT_41255 [Mycena sanguinolenta]|nr:hypothetical protein C8R45DRAFT_41255 [Mycena sanguinolenta]